MEPGDPAVNFPGGEGFEKKSTAGEPGSGDASSHEAEAPFFQYTSQDAETGDSGEDAGPEGIVSEEEKETSLNVMGVEEAEKQIDPKVLEALKANFNGKITEVRKAGSEDKRLS